jgi:uncharacterized protein (TIGR03435 family)
MNSQFAATAVALARQCYSRRVIPLWALPLLALHLAAQDQEFEVASIRPSNSSVTSAQVCHSLKPGVELLQVAGISLNFLVIDAYETETERFDLPDWGRTRFDVRLKLPPKTSAAACRQMLQSLLAKRFHMIIAVQNVEMPSYFLKVAKSGLKWKSVEGPPADPSASSSRKMENSLSHWVFRSAPMSRVLVPIQTDIVIGFRNGIYGTDRLIDETGLTGYYDGELKFQAALQSDAESRFSQGPTLTDALIEQVGLTLELRKAPAKVLTIRSADRTPTDN